jgi:hypothetical protein
MNYLLQAGTLLNRQPQKILPSAIGMLLSFHQLKKFGAGKVDQTLG